MDPICKVAGHKWGPIEKGQRRCERCGAPLTIVLKTGKAIVRPFATPVKPCGKGRHDWQPMGDRRFLECSKCGNMKLKPKT